MKKIVLATVAAIMIGAPVVEAQAASPQWQGQHERVRPDHGKRQWNHGPSKHHEFNRKKAYKNHWKRGQRVPDWKRHGAVRDWKRHGLHRPGHGQQWIKVGNDYLLISIVSGIIGGMIAAH